MADAGQYPDRLQWLKRTTTKDPDTGEDQETFPLNGYLWCSIEPNVGRRQQDYGAEQTGVDGQIRIRNMPAVSALDRLYSAEWDETWILEDIVRGANELIVRCHRFDDLVL